MKEWKGNSDSVRSRLGINKAHTTDGRDNDDFYATDPKALDALLRGCSKWLGDRFDVLKKHHTPIWECACGNGNLSELMISKGYDVISSDLKYRGYGNNPPLDFLAASANWVYRCQLFTIDTIITNPPYSMANEFILHALDILPQGGVYIALMNISYLCGKKRYEQIYSMNCLREIYVFSSRIECWKNNNREEYGGKKMADYAWYVFENGYNGQTILYWL